MLGMLHLFVLVEHIVDWLCTRFRNKGWARLRAHRCAGFSDFTRVLSCPSLVPKTKRRELFVHAVRCPA